jgi:predicted transcriptional regulator
MVLKNSKSKKVLLLLCVSSCFASYGNTRRYSREYQRKELLEQPTRSSIFELIKQNPGLHFRAICRVLDKKMGVVQYHISVLENAGLIRSIRDGRYKCFFATNQKNVNPEDRDPVLDRLSDYITTNLRKDTPSKLIIHLVREDEASHQKLSQVASVSPQAITFHTKRLAKFGIIESSKEGRQKFYKLSDPAREITENLLG